MYDTYPKFSLGFVAMLPIAALVLPAVMVFPSVGQTAAGMQIALMLLVLVVIRMILLPDQQIWLNVADLVALAGLANWAVFRQAPSVRKLGQRALNVLSLTLCMARSLG